jgi:hypothetical protein
MRSGIRFSEDYMDLRTRCCALEFMLWTREEVSRPSMSKRYPVEQCERAVKMVLDHLEEYRSVNAAVPGHRSEARGRRGVALQAQVDAIHGGKRVRMLFSALACTDRTRVAA